MFKVKCKLVSFVGDEKNYPCHFNYKVGDEIYYDGDVFTGRICNGLLQSMMPIVKAVFLNGNKYAENIMYRYRGFDVRDPAMVKYDGLGFAPMKKVPEGASPKMANVLSSFFAFPKTEKVKVVHFVCGDTRTLANFSCEAIDISDGLYCQPFYRREVAILDKVAAEPGIKPEDVVTRFSQFEREDISPPLSPVLMQVLFEALMDMKYLELRKGGLHATGRQPPSRPQVG